MNPAALVLLGFGIGMFSGVLLTTRHFIGRKP